MAVSAPVLGAFTLLYLAVVSMLAYRGYRRTKCADDYLVGGRNIHPVILALSYGAAFISTSAIVGFGGLAGQIGMGLLWLTVLNIGVGILIAFAIFGKRTRALGKKLGARTFPDLLGKVYDSSFIRKAGALIVVAGMPLYAAAILIGGARFIESTLGVSYNTALLGFTVVVALYVIVGGLIAVMYTDALQGCLMLVGMTLLLVLTYVKLGGISEAHAALTGMKDLVPAGLQQAGHAGWTSMPTMGSSLWYTLITTVVLGVGIGVLAQPQLVVRFMSVKSDRSLNRAILVGGPFIMLMTGVAFTVGALTNVYFYREAGQTALEAAGGNVDAIIPLYINASMPDVFIILFMLALLSAAMSTLSSLFHTMGAALGYDLLLGRTREGAAQKTAQASTAVMIVASVALAYVMPGNIIARATAMFMGLCASALLPAFVMALYDKAPSALAAKTSIVTGAAVWFAWTAFVHVKESAALRISSFLFGKDTLLSMPWPVVDPLVIALPLSALALVAMKLWETRSALPMMEEGAEPL